MSPDGYTIEHYQINITDEIMYQVAFYCCIISGCAFYILLGQKQWSKMYEYLKWGKHFL